MDKSVIFYFAELCPKGIIWAKSFTKYLLVTSYNYTIKFSGRPDKTTQNNISPLYVFFKKFKVLGVV